MNEILSLFAIKDVFLCLFILGARIAAFCSVSVYFSSQYFTGTARRAIMVSLTLILLPLLPTSSIKDIYNDTWIYLAYVLKETILGVLLGFFSNFIFYVTQGVGFLIDTQRGASVASLFDPISNSQTSPLGDLLMKFTILLAISSGAFITTIQLLYESYIDFPIFSIVPSCGSWITQFALNVYGDGIFNYIALFAGPIIFVLFLSEFGLGLVTRFAPQLNVFFLSMPIKSALAMFFFILYLAFLAEYIVTHFANFDLMQKFLTALKGS